MSPLDASTEQDELHPAIGAPALADAYLHHRPWLTALLTRRYGPDEAADIAQDTYLRVHDYTPPSPLRSPRALLARIALNLAANRFRKTARETPTDPADAIFARQASASSQEQAILFEQMMLARMNLWLSPHVCAATDVSDFDLRDLRDRRLSLYLGVSPDNLARIAPLYNLLLQQLIDLNTRELPTLGRHDIPVLVLLDEFARLGHAGVIARGFSYVAGYGLRLLPVIQSPAQLRAEYGPDLAEEIISNCGVEVAFAPKELKVAQDLSERLGYWTYASRSKSRPSLLSTGRRSVSESDQRRALMMPQELTQMDAARLIVLRANMPPVRARKIVYWRERVFTRRVLPPPEVPPHPDIGQPRAALASTKNTATAGGPLLDDLTLTLDLSPLAAAGLQPLPPRGATEAEVEAWVERLIDASARPAQEPGHAR